MITLKNDIALFKKTKKKHNIFAAVLLFWPDTILLPIIIIAIISNIIVKFF